MVRGKDYKSARCLNCGYESLKVWNNEKRRFIRKFKCPKCGCTGYELKNIY